MSIAFILKIKIPQIFIGASNSSSMGYDKSISLALIHKPLIYYSVKAACFIVLWPLVSNNLSMILSTSNSKVFS